MRFPLPSLLSRGGFGALCLVVCLWSAVGAQPASGPFITEFQAVNSSTLADEDGQFSDWLEIHNAHGYLVHQFHYPP